MKSLKAFNRTLPQRTKSYIQQKQLQGNTLDRIHGHDPCAVLGQAGAIGPIEFLVRHRHDVLFQFESKSVLHAHKICKVLLVTTIKRFASRACAVHLDL